MGTVFLQNCAVSPWHSSHKNFFPSGFNFFKDGTLQDALRYFAWFHILLLVLNASLGSHQTGGLPNTNCIFFSYDLNYNTVCTFSGILPYCAAGAGAGCAAAAAAAWAWAAAAAAAAC